MNLSDPIAITFNVTSSKTESLYHVLSFFFSSIIFNQEPCYLTVDIICVRVTFQGCSHLTKI